MIRDLSLGGVMLKDREPLPPGSPIVLTLHLGLDTLSCSGVVKWANPRRGMGIQFVEFSPPAQKRLSNCVMEIGLEGSRQRLNESLNSSSGTLGRSERAPANGRSPIAGGPASSSTLGELLVQRGVITAEQLTAAKPLGRQHGGQFAASLVRLGYVSEDDLLAFVQKEYRLPAIELSTIAPVADVLRLVPKAIARCYEVFPVGLTDAILTVAIADPSNLTALREIKLRTGCELRIVLAPALAIQQVIERCYDELARNAG